MYVLIRLLVFQIAGIPAIIDTYVKTRDLSNDPTWVISDTRNWSRRSIYIDRKKIFSSIGLLDVKLRRVKAVRFLKMAKIVGFPSVSQKPITQIINKQNK